MQGRRIDVIVYATGSPEVGTQLAMLAIRNGKHIVMLNVEADITVGRLLARRAREAGIVYTGSAGDEPASTLELIAFAQSLGMDVIAAGKGKNNPLRHDAVPAEYEDEARERNMNARMLVEFIDGSKTMVEMTAIANCTGLKPDVPGMHGPEATRDNLGQVLCTAEDGGILSKAGCVDYTIGKGVAPGVFCVVKPRHPRAIERMADLKVGPGPCFRPDPAVPPDQPRDAAVGGAGGNVWPAGHGAVHRPVAECGAVAKRDLSPGEMMGRIGETEDAATPRPGRRRGAGGRCRWGSPRSPRWSSRSPRANSSPTTTAPPTRRFSSPACGPNSTPPTAASPPEGAAVAFSFRAVTWNCHGSIGSGFRCDPQRTLAVIRRLRPDILALQEVNGRRHLGRQADAFGFFAAHLGGHVVEARAVPGRDAEGAYGHLLWSRWPLDEAHVETLPGPGVERRAFAAAVVRAPQAAIAAVASTSGCRRRRAAVGAGDRTPPAARPMLVVMGDTNEWRRHGPVDRALRRLAPVCAAQPTWPARLPIVAMDRVRRRRTASGERSRRP